MYELIVKLPVNGFFLEGDLALPVKAKSLIIFSDSQCRSNSHCRLIARYLQRAGFGTLLFDLMTQQERSVAKRRPDVELLTQRLLSFTIWIRSHSEYHKLVLAYIGFGVGGAVALRAAGDLREAIAAVVTENARTDLAADRLTKVICPTLLIVPELDFHTLGLNRKALKKLRCDKHLVVIPGASHTMEEPGKTGMGARDATVWFAKYLPGGETTAKGEEDLEYETVEEE